VLGPGFTQLDEVVKQVRLSENHASANAILYGVRQLLAIWVSLSGMAIAQGVFERIPGEFSIVGQAVNAEGTVFIEIDSVVYGVFGAVKAGMPTDVDSMLVIIAPDKVHIGQVKKGEVFYRSEWWYDLVQMSKTRPELSLEPLTFTQVSSLRLNPEYIAAALARPRPNHTFAGGPSCTSTTTSSGSTTSCYSGGHLTYRSTCTVSSMTGAITCRSSSY